MSNLNFQQGDNNKNSQKITESNADSAWRLIWTAVVAGLIVAIVIALWKLFLG